MLNHEKAFGILNQNWTEIEKLSSNEILKKDFVSGDLKEKIKILITSSAISFRYAILTQVLAKVVDPSVNCLALQAKAPLPGAFDARSFCKRVVIPFEREKLNNILGGSGDPYVSKPLRHEIVSLNVIKEIKDKQGWKMLYEVLEEIERRKEDTFTSEVLKQILLEIRRSLLQQPIQLPPLPPISVEQLREILVSFLSKPSEGVRPQVIVYALLETFNEKTKTFADITTAKATTADIYAKRVADIECRDMDGYLKLAVSVTDVLGLEKLKDELEKAVKNNVKNLLVVAHKIKDWQEAEKIIKKYSFLNVTVSQLVSFVTTMTLILNNEMRRKLILTVYEKFKELGYLDHLREWNKIINEKIIMP